MNNFVVIHRKYFSTYSIIKYALVFCIGILFLKEIKVLSKLILNFYRLLIYIVGEFKISNKFNILNNLVKKLGILIVREIISNIFIFINNEVDKSL